MNTTKKIAVSAEDSSATGQKDIEVLLADLHHTLRPAGPAQAPLAGQRCGLIAIVGKPNVGKSTLLNALVGQKISITSRKAQTTRHRITGIRSQDATQLVFVDTPGFQTIHGNALNKSLNKTVVGAVADVDLILFVVEAGSFTPADARVLALLGKDIPTLLIANKLDNVHRRSDIAPWLQTMQIKHAFAEFVPMSAKSPNDIDRLLEICVKYLPEQAWWYAADELTDRSERFMAAEMVRDKLFRL
ncbi:MAG: GTPase Era, partial [Rhodoferax sp.]|nr:GTPase Era [Rhodoferax sp.]